VLRITDDLPGKQLESVFSVIMPLEIA